MPSIRNVGTRVRYSIERLDGGYNSKDSPSKIGASESPDCLNVVYDDTGSVATRDGSVTFNTQAIGTTPIDGLTSFNGSMIAWAGGSMYRASGTTFVTIGSAQGKFTSGVKVAYTTYQNLLFSSDGTNGPWKYDGSGFYNMGIDIPSAPTGATSGAGTLTAGTYYYGVSFVNSQAVEGEIGSISPGITIAASLTIGLTGIPVGSSLAGVNSRVIYRRFGLDGDFYRVAEIADNTTTTYTDNIHDTELGGEPVEDGTKPTPFTTIALHKERLFFDDSTDRSLLRWTDLGNPFISQVENFEPIDNKDGENIIAIATQDEFVNIFKSNNNYSIQTTDPADETTWISRKSPANLGIVGPRAFTYGENGILFIGKRNNRITGLHFMTGLQVVQSFEGRLRTENISEKVEYDFLNRMEPTYWSNMAMGLFENRLYLAYTGLGEARNAKILWLDTNRIVLGQQPDGWSPWTGIESNVFTVHNGKFYAGSSNSNGFVYQLEAGVYSDSGTAINSYFWTKEIGGEDDGSLDSYVKDFRELYIWQARLGSYNMSVRVRTDGSTGAGSAQNIDLSPGGSVWGTMVWGLDPWGGARDDFETRLALGKLLGKRLQVRFDNQNTAGQAFQVHRVELGMNLRRRR